MTVGDTSDRPFAALYHTFRHLTVVGRTWTKEEFSSLVLELRESYDKAQATRRHSQILRATATELRRQAKELQLANSRGVPTEPSDA